MNKIFRQKFIKVLALLAITNAVFAGSFVYAYTPQWTDFRTNNYTGGNSYVLKNATYWEVNIVGATNGGIIIGDPFYKQAIQITNVSPLVVDYQVMSNTNCVMRYVYGNSTNGVSGSTQITLTAGTRATTSITFTTPATQAGINGMAVYRNVGTADCVVRFYSITAYDGTLLWSPTQNLDTYSGILNVTNATSSGGTSFPEEITVSNQNDQLVNFALLAFLFAGTVLFIIVILKPLYVRK